MSNKKRKCYNCKFGGDQFKINKLTHLHCENPEEYPEEIIESPDFSAWETLRVFSDTCDKHEFKEVKTNE